MKTLLLFVLFALYLPLQSMDVPDLPEEAPTLQQLALEQFTTMPKEKLLQQIERLSALPKNLHANLASFILVNKNLEISDKQTVLNKLSIEPHEYAVLGLAVLLANLTIADKNALLNALITKVPTTPDNNGYIQTLQLFTRRANETFNNGINTTFTPVTLAGLPLAALAQHSSTLLIDAIRAGNTYAVQLLLVNGADSNLAPFDDQEYKPLRLALEARPLTQEKKEMVRLLLQTGADTNFGDTVRENAFYIAAERQDQELMDLLKENADINKLFKHPAHTTPVTILDRIETIAQSNPEFYNPIVEFLQAIGAQRSADLPAPMATETQ